MARSCFILAVLLCGLLSGCDRQPVKIAGTGGPFDPISFFAGHTQSWGVIENRFAAPDQALQTSGDAHLDAGGRLQMSQTLTYQDGKTQQRVWTLWRTGGDHYSATANDMIGTAEGTMEGNAFHWQWTLARSPGNPLMNVQMHQWMYRLPDGTALIRTTVTKLGFIVAEVTEHFAHPDGTNSPHPGA